MAMIFALGCLDILPAADIGLQRATAEHYGITRDAAGLTELAESWRPWRTVAVWYLWRERDPVPGSVMSANPVDQRDAKKGGVLMRKSLRNAVDDFNAVLIFRSCISWLSRCLAFRS